MSSKSANAITSETFADIRANLASVVIGQDQLLKRLIVCLLCRSHLLIEGLPGLAKTLSVKALAKAMDVSFARIQFTPDLLPADVTGSEIFDNRNHSFSFVPGPLFHQLVLADEINRAPAKVQSALLEAMGEGHISVGNTTYTMKQPFFVVATMNPIEQEGTYQLPEAQLDRFLLKSLVHYPSYKDEITIAESQVAIHKGLDAIRSLCSGQDILAAQQAVDAIAIAPSLVDFCVRLVRATRGESEDTRFARWIAYGAGTRASLALVAASKALAYMNGRSSVEPDDIMEIAPDVLRHRLQLSFDADSDQVDCEQVIRFLLESIKFY